MECIYGIFKQRNIFEKGLRYCMESRLFGAKNNGTPQHVTHLLSVCRNQEICYICYQYQDVFS